jgi:hypothetical protein
MKGRPWLNVSGTARDNTYYITVSSVYNMLNFAINCSIDGRGTMLQAGRSSVQLPMGVSDFFSVNLVHPASSWLQGLLSL